MTVYIPPDYFRLQKPPSVIASGSFTYDNTAGASDYVAPLASGECMAVLIRVVSGSCYIGGYDRQDFPLSQGDTIAVSIDKLDKLHVRVPAGASVTLAWLAVG